MLERLGGAALVVIDFAMTLAPLGAAGLDFPAAARLGFQLLRPPRE